MLLDRKGPESWNFVICDFGCANILNDSRIARGLQPPQMFGMTVKYAAPELLRRAKAKIDLHSGTGADKLLDVYAFGMTMFESVTKSKAWSTLDSKAITEAVLAGSRPDFPANMLLDSGGRHLQDLVGMIQACWSQIPTARPSFEKLREIFGSN